MLKLESQKVRMVGIWGPSGIGKTTIGRALYSQLSRNFQSRIFIDKHFISTSNKDYRTGNPIDCSMKLHLQESFLSELLGKPGIKVDNFGAMKWKLKHHKVLIIIDDLDDKDVLEASVDGDEWFGPGSRIISITTDKQILRGHGIKYVYEVGTPSSDLALQILCRSAFKQNSPHDGFKELASEVAVRVGGLPLALNVLGSSLFGVEKSFWVDTVLTLWKGLYKKIEKALSMSYERLERKEHKSLFRHIACFFIGDDINYIKLMLADSELNVNTGLKILVDKSLIHVRPSWNNTNIVEMHCLVQEMGKEIVRTQSDKLGEREFLMDSKDVCNVLKGSTGTEKVLGISLDLDEVGKVQIHEKAFKGMSNLRFLKFYKKSLERKEDIRWQLPKKFNVFPDELKLLSWPGYPMIYMPFNFCPENLVELRMPNSKLKTLWEGVEQLACLRVMELSESEDLEAIPDLSKAINLETLNLHGCSSLVEIPSSSIKNLNKLTVLNMAGCTKLEALPDGINLESLNRLILIGCSKLKVFPNISSKIESFIANKTAFQIFPSELRLENLVELCMEQITSERLWEGVQPLTSLKKIVFSGCANLKEIPNLMMATGLEILNLSDCSSLVELTLSTLENLNKLTYLEMRRCSSLETLPEGINLQALFRVDLTGCSRLRSFPNISNNISILTLNQTGIEEVPRWIENFCKLGSLQMWRCRQLKLISPRIFKLDNIEDVFFSECEQLTGVRWSEEAEDTNNTRTKLSVIIFSSCFYSNQEAFIHQSDSECLLLPGIEVPPYFTYRSSGSSLTIPLHCSSLSQQSLDFKACVVVSEETINHQVRLIDIVVHCRFRDKQGNYFEPHSPWHFYLHQKYNHLTIFDCRFPLNQDCDQVDIEFRLASIPASIELKLKGCGLRLFDDSTPIPATQNEAEESKVDDDDEGYETPFDEEECGDNSDDEGYETAFGEEECGDNSRSY